MHGSLEIETAVAAGDASCLTMTSRHQIGGRQGKKTDYSDEPKSSFFEDANFIKERGYFIRRHIQWNGIARYFKESIWASRKGSFSVTIP